MAIVFDHMKNHPMVANVMVIDDQLTSRIILETIIQGIGDNVKTQAFDNAVEALEVAISEPPDLVIVDYKMPEMDGVEFTRRLRREPGCTDIPVIVITILDEKAVMYQALEAGATDFLNKPVDHYECKVRCRNLLTLRQQQIIIKNRAISLETKVKDIAEQVHTREIEILSRLARAGELRSGVTSPHLTQMARVARLIAEELGLSAEFCNMLEIAAPMYDIGKIGIPDHILFKKNKLNAAESEVMKKHTQIGYEILRDSPSLYLQMGAVIALNHHEKFNGEGYPNKLAKDNIPIEARIVAVAEAFDVLTSPRPNEGTWRVKDAIREITRQQSTNFDPDCVKALQTYTEEILACPEASKVSSL